MVLIHPFRLQSYTSLPRLGTASEYNRDPEKTREIMFFELICLLDERGACRFSGKRVCSPRSTQSFNIDNILAAGPAY